MNDWTFGYVVDRDIGYTYGYYGELNPLRTRMALLGNGLTPAGGIRTACELGFGQGLSVNMHAATSDVEWWGTDFNPAQAGFARELAGASQSAVNLFDEAFSEFCARTDLPDFDFIGLHGIWSWISDENRALIVDFIRRKLRVGGVVYISYNTMPGWGAFAPMRNLLTEHAEVMAAPGRGLVSRIDAAIDFAEKLLETKPRYLAASPLLAERLKAIKGQSRQYLAHEYFNRDWAPMSFSDMAKWLGPGKLDYACSAHFIEHIDAINLTSQQRQFLADIPDRMFRESTRDFMFNQQFRRDYWVKGIRSVSPVAQLEHLRDERLVLLTPVKDIPRTVKGANVEANLHEDVYGPILAALDKSPLLSVAELEKNVSAKKVGLAQILEAVAVLIGGGHVAPAQNEAAADRAKLKSRRLNMHLMQMARANGDIGFLASPVTGGGVPVPRMHQLYLLGSLRGSKNPVDWAKSVWDDFGPMGRRLVVEGKTLQTPEENIRELERQAREFAEKNLPILQRLQVV